MRHRRFVFLVFLVITLSAVTFTISMAENQMSPDLDKPDTPPGQQEDEYTAGFGLILDQFEFSVDNETIQSRIVNDCLEGESIQQVNQNGSVICEPDDDTLSYKSCSSNQVLKYDGVEWICADDVVGSSFSYHNVVVVAKSNGDYTSVQTAIDSITDASAVNPYLVWIAPGVYEEQVTMKPFVHLQGAGQDATIISSTVSDFGGTLLLASDTNLRDLTVKNQADSNSVALLSTDGMTRTLVIDVTALANGGNSTYDYSIGILFVGGSGSGGTFQQVTARGEGSSGYNIGLYNQDAELTLLNGSFIGRGGLRTIGIYNRHSDDTAIYAEGVTAIGEDGDNENWGLRNIESAKATLRGGFFTGRGGTGYSIGISISNGILDAQNITVLGENGSGNFGLSTYSSVVSLRGGSFIGRGGFSTRGIYNGEGDPILYAESVTALGEGGSFENYGLYTRGTTTLSSGSFIGRGGTYAYGIRNYYNGATLEAESVTSMGENGTDSNYGFYNYQAAVAIIRGGSFTGRSGLNAYGIYNDDFNNSPTIVLADNIRAVGEDGSNFNYGLYNNLTTSPTSYANISQSVLSGVTNSVYNAYGDVTLSNTRLVFGPVVGSVTCVLVTRGTGIGSVSTDGSTCP